MRARGINVVDYKRVGKKVGRGFGYLYIFDPILGISFFVPRPEPLATFL